MQFNGYQKSYHIENSELLYKMLRFDNKLIRSVVEMQISLQLKAMNGTSYGALQVVKATCTKVWMNIKKLITFLKAMKLQERIDYALIWSECKKGMENNILISFLIHIFSQMSLVNFMNIIKS